MLSKFPQYYNDCNTVEEKYCYLWKFAEIAYSEPEEIDLLIFAQEANRVKMLANEVDYSFSVLYDKWTTDSGLNYIIFSFRGTEGKNAWIGLTGNLNVFPLQEGTIPEGIYLAWAKLKHDIERVLHVLPINTKIAVTGHSRGFMLAGLCARHIMKNMNRQCELLGFGTPCIGNRAFAEEFKKLVKSTKSRAVRINLGNDIVANNKLDDIYEAEHIGIEIKLPVPFWHSWLKIFKILDHRPKSYRKAIKKIIKKMKYDFIY